MKTSLKELGTTIADRVHKLRLERRWTQTRLANLLGISQNYLSWLEHGKGSFTAEQLLTILQEFNLTLDYFAPKQASIESQLQNALARQGAGYLLESNDIIPSERLKDASNTIRETLVSAESTRQIAALAPLLVNLSDTINLDKLYGDLAAVHRENRLGWIIENTLKALEKELASKNLPEGWRYKYKLCSNRIKLLTGSWRHVALIQNSHADSDILDKDIVSEETVKEVRKDLSDIAKRWRIITRMDVKDFVTALRRARESN